MSKEANSIFRAFRELDYAIKNLYAHIGVQTGKSDISGLRSVTVPDIVFLELLDELHDRECEAINRNYNSMTFEWNGITFNSEFRQTDRASVYRAIDRAMDNDFSYTTPDGRQHNILTAPFIAPTPAPPSPLPLPLPSATSIPVQGGARRPAQIPPNAYPPDMIRDMEQSYFSDPTGRPWPRGYT